MDTSHDQRNGSVFIWHSAVFEILVSEKLKHRYLFIFFFCRVLKTIGHGRGRKKKQSKRILNIQAGPPQLPLERGMREEGDGEGQSFPFTPAAEVE